MSESDRRTFVDSCLLGIAFAGDVDDWVDEWHDADGLIDGEAISLRDRLGMTAEEYGLWVEQPSAVEFIVASHKRGKPVSELMTSHENYALAARSANPEATQEVLMWLVRTGRVDPESASRA